MMAKFLAKLSHPSVRITCIVLLIVPLVHSVLFINTNGVNVPYWDEWGGMIPLFEKYYAGNLTFADLYQQHNEHRILFPKLLMLLVGIATGYNTVVEMYIGWLFLTFCAGVVFVAYRRQFGDSDLPLIRFVPVAWLFYSWRQHENFLWGWQITFFMASFAVVLALYLLALSRSLDKYFYGALASAIVASFSNANGLLIWPIGLLQVVAAQREQRNAPRFRSRLMIFVWGLTAVSVFAAYFSAFHGVEGHPSMLYLFRDPSYSIKYLFAVIGSPLAAKPLPAIFCGLALAFVGTIVYIRTFVKSLSFAFSFWDSLIVFASLTCAMLVVGRAGFGVIEQGLSSRYTTFLILGIVALYVKLFENVQQSGKLETALRMLLTGLIFQGLVVSFVNGKKEGRRTRNARQTASSILSDLAAYDDEAIAKYLYPHAGYIREKAKFMASYKINVFNKRE